jgi:hypothetical protein
VRAREWVTGTPRSRHLLAIALLTGCARADRPHVPTTASAHETAVISAALTELFARREHAQAITIWEDGREFAPTLAAFGGVSDDTDTMALVSTRAQTLAVPFRVERTTLRDMEAFFRTDPEGWDAWFEAHPGNAGVVEIVRPRVTGDSAEMIVGRVCGEHCRTAWRLQLGRTGDRWTVRTVAVVRVPR